MINDKKKSLHFYLRVSGVKVVMVKIEKIFKLIKIFYESFANKKEKPALIIKNKWSYFSILDKEECLKKLNQKLNLYFQKIGIYQMFIYYMVICQPRRNESFI